MMERAESGSDSGVWTCNRCKLALEAQKVRLQYSGTIFAIDLPVCHRCGMILIDEELATGKMAEAEQAIEDK